ncbi:MAG: SDR family oxidoreductase [Candidatus Pacebacteria bacterium]|nr:SDR family oxidoreductase [Candidatus Paceibacterota bacterium]
MKELQELADCSRRYGGDLEYVFLGGGNTSYKDTETLYIKPSGVALATITAEQFLAMDRVELRRLFTESLPTEAEAREARAKQLMLAAVRPPESGRPSVEAPVHEAIPRRYVVHLHPAAVNGMTCAVDGRQTCRQLFPNALWMDYTDPGCVLAHAVHKRMQRVKETGGDGVIVLFLQNHGVFVGADSLDEIRRAYDDVMDTLMTAYNETGESVALTTGRVDSEAVQEYAPVLRAWAGGPTHRATVCAAEPFDPAEGPLSPDHVVYAGSYPYLGGFDQEEYEQHVKEVGVPKIVSVAGKAVFACGETLNDARAVMTAARDGALVEQLTHAFGGPNYLSNRARQFIENWEVEAHRKKVSGGAGAGGLRGRICVVTGAAQGFGLGIADGLAAAGAVVAVADLNEEGAREAAAELERKYGSHSAFSVPVNVADEESVRGMVAEVVRTCGGCDVFIANAGVLRAGSVREMTLRNWQFVTDVNYTGYFLCVKHIAPVMAKQNGASDDALWSDIIQVNSKSGLEGSNRNAAYAGSKFGTIGMTQSFAKELVEEHIKVNSVCPGNYLEGPLWSDPENGLFVQYLRTGKVPGAETIEDVKRFYEGKVPMGRGCRPADVVNTILYLVNQTYETGQAVPITGGQVMLA